MRRLDWNHLKKKFHEIHISHAFALALTSFAINTTYLVANPINPVIVSGTASFDTSTASTLRITADHNTIINWDSFSIGAGETTTFLQPNSSAAILNRVTGNDLSNILGSLQANGSVYLINKNGILIGHDAFINTNSFLASTLDIQDSDFLAGKDLPFLGSTINGIVNLGTIESSGGDIVLLGYYVDNQGTLNADHGGARLSSGSKLLLQVNGGPERILIQSELPDVTGEQAGIFNSGTINAVVAELKADGNPYLYGINHSGQINATGIVSQNGQVYLRAEKNAVCISGQTTAINQDQTGGSATILGKKIVLTDTAVIDVSGDNGGGSAYIGGGFQGKDPSLPNAEHLYVLHNAQVKANANTQGNGGTIIFWADGITSYSGLASAKGGSLSGNGGLIETSGKTYLNYQGFSDLSAAFGNKGTLLLDPSNLTISNNATTNVFTPGGFPAGPVSAPYNYWEIYPNPAGTTTSNLNLANLNTALGVADVVVQTGLDGGIGSGDITWVGNLSTSNKGNLTLNSVNNIYFVPPSGGPTGFATPSDFNLIASGNIEFLGGSTSNSSISIVANNNLNITSYNGDVILQAGTGSQSGVSVFGNNSVIVNTEKGSLKIIGGQNTVSGTNSSNLLGRQFITISTGQDLLLNAGNGINAQSLITAIEMNLDIGNDCKIISEGGTGTSNSQISAAILTANFGNDLIIQGGTQPSNFAAINGVDADFTINIGGNLEMIAGTADNTFAQIGCSTGTSSGNISINSIGGNAILNANTSATNAYSVIGHGNFLGFGGSTGQFGGNIFIKGGPESTLVLSGGQSFNGSFAQIGHFRGDTFSTSSVPITGNITVSDFGDINLNPNSSYASIGHGYSNVLAPSIFGNVSLLANVGSVGLNAGLAQHAFSQIGHFNATITTGDITVNTTGEINLTAGNFQSSEAIIGQGNFFNPTGSSFSGSIVVSGQNINVFSGMNGPFNNAVIGFEPGDPTSLRSCSINPSSNISVKALYDIQLVSQNGLQARSGNAIIGHEANANSPSISSINSISVTSDNGNISLFGGNSANGLFPITNQAGKAIIGTDSNPGSLTNFPTSNVNVKAPNGTIYLYANLPSQSQFSGGTAAILNGNTLPSPHFVNISAENIYLAGGTSSNTLNGNAYICSTNNLNIKTDFDLQMLGNSFAIQNQTFGGTANIYALGGVTSFDIGQDLLLYGGTSDFADAQIGTFPNFLYAPTTTSFSIGRDLTMIAGAGNLAIAIIGYSNPPTKSDIIFKNIGGNVLLQGAFRSFSTIGHGFGFDHSTLSGDIIFENIGTDGIGGNVTLVGSTTPSSQSTDFPGFAQIGHKIIIQPPGATVAGDIRFNNVGGAVNLTSGAQQCYTQIGHGNLYYRSSGETFTGDIVLNAESVTLTGGSDKGADAVIGFSTTTSLSNPSVPSSNTTVNSSLIQINSNGPVTLTAGNDSNAVIGYYNPQSTGDNITIANINVKASEGNVSLTGGIIGVNQGGNAIIGTLVNSDLGQAHSSIKITTPKDVLLSVPSELNGQAIITNSSDFTTFDSRTLYLDPNSIILLGGSGNAEIYSSGNLTMNFTDALNINYDANNPTQLQNSRAIVHAQGDIFINTFVPSYGDIFITGTQNTEAGNSGIQSLEGSVMIGTLKQIGAGDVTIGQSNMSSAAFIEADNGDVIANISGNLLMQAGTPTESLSEILANRISINSAGSISLFDNGSRSLINSTGSGFISLTALRDFLGSGNGSISAMQGNISTIVGRDILLFNSFTFSGSGISDQFFQAGRNILLSDNANVNLSSSGILKMTAEIISLSNNAVVQMSGSGDLFMIADSNMYLNDQASIVTAGGALNLVVDNDSPDPAFYGRGKLVKDKNVNINSNNGPINIFTSTQPFNSISGNINGVPFVPGRQFVNTPLEQWGDYYDTAFNGSPYTLFYKNNGTPIPIPRHFSHARNEFIVAASEALQEWKYLDQLQLVPFGICSTEYILKKCTPEYYCLKSIYLRKELITYNTKKLLEILE